MIDFWRLIVLFIITNIESAQAQSCSGYVPDVVLVQSSYNIWYDDPYLRF